MTLWFIDIFCCRNSIKKAQYGAGGYVGEAGDEVGNSVGNKIHAS